MVNTRNEIINLLMGTEREGITELVNHMSEHGFFDAPCSGKFHLCVPGGLAEHSLNVYKAMKDLAEAWEVDIAEESIVICSLLHDLGKMGDYGKPNYVENILKSGKVSEAEPYKTNPELLYLDHEVRSVMIASRYIFLEENEAQAILWHNGLYGPFKYEIQNKETTLYMLLHFADMWASRVVEAV